MSSPRTHHKRKLFLDQLELGQSPSFAALAAGESLGFFRRWRDTDRNFKQDWEDAEEAGTDYLEDVATERAVKKSDQLMAMILKARRPEKYDRASKLELSGGISVEGSKQKLLNKLAKMRTVEGQVISSSDAVPQADDGAKEETTKALPAPEQHIDATAIRTGSKRQRATGRGGRQGSATA